jgi:hypothetical protein
MFEDFSDDILKKANPIEPMDRSDLIGSAYDYKELPNKETVYAVEFVPSGTFGAINAAQTYLKDLGYTIGSMQMSSPIGFADSDKYDYVSKWWNMNREDKESLDGAIIPLDGFREGGVLVLFFKEPKL